MKRKARIVLIVAMVLAMTFWWFLRTPWRVSYQGKSVRIWAGELYATYEPRGTNAAANAFRAMGPEAVPALRSLAVAGPPASERILLRYGAKIPRRLRVYLYQKVRPGQTVELRIGAMRALAAIGPDAKDALPELLFNLAETDGRIRWVAAQCVGALGPDAISSLLPLTTNADANLRHVTVYALGETRSNALPATFPLIKCTLDTNDSVRASAYYSLSRIGPAALPIASAIALTNPVSELRTAAYRALPVLSPGGQIYAGRVLQTNDAELRRIAILSLVRGRQTNETAIALFTNALADEDPKVRETAALALRWVETGKPR